MLMQTLLGCLVHQGAWASFADPTSIQNFIPEKRLGSVAIVNSGTAEDNLQYMEWHPISPGILR